MMAAEDARRAYNGATIEVACMSLEAHHRIPPRHSTTLNIYAFRDAPEHYLWLIWDGPIDFNNISASIKAGGELFGPLALCAASALGQLFTYLGRRAPSESENRPA